MSFDELVLAIFLGVVFAEIVIPFILGLLFADTDPDE